MRSAAIAATVGLALLVSAGPAVADSITYVKDNNIWVAGPDGTAVHQITRDGTAVTARALLGKRPVGTSSARLRKAGSVAVHVRISRAGAGYLHSHRHAKLSVRVTFTPDSGPAIRMNATVRIT
jgi:hypothetical protein